MALTKRRQWNRNSTPIIGPPGWKHVAYTTTALVYLLLTQLYLKKKKGGFHTKYQNRYHHETVLYPTDQPDKNHDVLMCTLLVGGLVRLESGLSTPPNVWGMWHSHSLLHKLLNNSWSVASAPTYGTPLCSDGLFSNIEAELLLCSLFYCCVINRGNSTLVSST